MPVRAYILIETMPGKSRDVVAQIRSLPGVASADRVTGPYDVVVVLGTESLDQIGQILTHHIHTISGVMRTVTCIVVPT